MPHIIATARKGLAHNDATASGTNRVHHTTTTPHARRIQALTRADHFPPNVADVWGPAGDGESEPTNAAGVCAAASGVGRREDGVPGSGSGSVVVMA